MRVKTFVPFLALFMVVAAGAAQAQTAGVVTLTANKTTSTGSFAPVLTWSTSPAANSCTASGGWSGTKAASGTQTLSTITASTNYTLTCSWSSGSANVTWVAPTQNLDGSALTNLAGFKVFYGTNSSSLTSSTTVDDMTRRSATISSLSPGTWYFAVRAFTSAGKESANSNVASKSVVAANAAKTVAITINATTPPPSSTYVTTGGNVWDVKQTNGVWARNQIIGTIAANRPCNPEFVIGSYILVSWSHTTLTKQPISSRLVAYCKKV
jgi:hypothetical protein